MPRHRTHASLPFSAYTHAFQIVNCVDTFVAAGTHDPWGTSSCVAAATCWGVRRLPSHPVATRAHILCRHANSPSTSNARTRPLSPLKLRRSTTPTYMHPLSGAVHGRRAAAPLPSRTISTSSMALLLPLARLTGPRKWLAI